MSLLGQIAQGQRAPSARPCACCGDAEPSGDGDGDLRVKADWTQRRRGKSRGAAQTRGKQDRTSIYPRKFQSSSATAASPTPS